MPQCSSSLQDIISNYFPGDFVSYDFKCIEFLKNRGYILTKAWCWVKPVPSHSINDEEFNCLQFLIDEWDFGGIEK